MTDWKTIDLSSDHNENDQVKPPNLRSPLVGNVPSTADAKNAKNPPVADQSKKPQSMTQPKPINDALPELNALVLRDDGTGVTGFLQTVVGWVLVVAILFGTGWFLKARFWHKLEKIERFRAFESSSGALVNQVTQKVLPRKWWHSQGEQSVGAAGDKHMAAAVTLDSNVFAASDCTWDNIDKMATGPHKTLVGKSYLNLCECAFYLDAPSRALVFVQQGIEVARAIKPPALNDMLSLRINYIRAKYKMWTNYADFKEIKTTCRGWNSSGECVERLLVESYFHGGVSTEKGFATLNAAKNFSKDVHAAIWLGGARSALKDGKYALAEERLLEASNSVTPEAYGLHKEIFETQLYDAYYNQNRSLAVATVAQAKTSLSKYDKNSIAELEALGDFIADKNIAGRKKTLIRYMNWLVSQERFNIDPFFLGALGFEAVMSRDTEFFLSFLAKVRKWFIDNGDTEKNVKRLLDRWHIRILVAANQYADAGQKLAHYEKELGADAFRYHYQAVIVLKSRLQKDTWIKVEQQSDLAIRAAPNWQSLYLKGLAVIEGKRFGEVPALISAMEKFAGNPAASNFIFYLKVDFLWAQGRADVAMKNIDSFIAKHGQSPGAMAIKDRISKRTSGKEAFVNDAFARPVLDSFGPLREDLRNDPLGPFAIADY